MGRILDPEHSKQELIPVSKPPSPLIFLINYSSELGKVSDLLRLSSYCGRHTVTPGSSDKEGLWPPCAVIRSNCLVPKPHITLEISSAFVVYLHE